MLIPPALMLGIDAALLLGLLATLLRGRSWQPQSAFALITIGALVASAILAASTQSRLEKFQPKEFSSASLSNAFATPLIATQTPPWKFPTDIPAQVLFRPTQWIGKPLAQTEIGRWTDTLLFPPDATAFIYYLLQPLRRLSERYCGETSSRSAARAEICDCSTANSRGIQRAHLCQ